MTPPTDWDIKVVRKIDSTLRVDPAKTEERIRRIEGGWEKDDLEETNPNVLSRTDGDEAEDVGWFEEVAPQQAPSGRWDSMRREASGKERA